MKSTWLSEFLIIQHKGLTRSLKIPLDFFKLIYNT